MRKSFAEPELVALLEAQKDPEVARLARNRDVVKALVVIFNGTLELMKINPARPAELALGLAGKGSKMADLGATLTGSPELRVGAFVSSQMVSTLGLLQLARFTPARATVYVGFAVAEKVVAMGGLIDKPTFSKCQMALASLTVTTGLTVTAGLGTATLAWLPGVVAIAAELANTLEACQYPPTREPPRPARRTH